MGPVGLGETCGEECLCWGIDVVCFGFELPFVGVRDGDRASHFW